MRCSNYHHLNIIHLVGDFVANVSLMVRLSALYRFSNGSHACGWQQQEDERSLMINAFKELPSEEMLQIARSFK